MNEVETSYVATNHDSNETQYDFNWAKDTCASFLDNDVEPSEVEWEMPFSELVKYPSGTKGRFGRNLIAQCFTDAKLNVSRRPTEDRGKYEWVINDLRVAIKTSFEGKNGVWFFQQIRESHNYDFLFWLGISPHDLKCFVIHSSEINDLICSEDLTEQHGKNRFWCIIDVNDKPDWYLGDATLNTAIDIISKFSEESHESHRGTLVPSTKTDYEAAPLESS